MQARIFSILKLNSINEFCFLLIKMVFEVKPETGERIIEPDHKGSFLENDPSKKYDSPVTFKVL